MPVARLGAASFLGSILALTQHFDNKTFHKKIDVGVFPAREEAQEGRPPARIWGTAT